MRIRNLLREIIGLALVFWGAFLSVCLGSYAPTDPSINQVVARGYEIKNLAGLIGAYIGGLLVEVFGVTAWAWPVVCFYLAVFAFFGLLGLSPWRWVAVALFMVCAMTWAATPWVGPSLAVGPVSGGGLIGSGLYVWSMAWLKTYGTVILWVFLTLTAFQLALGLTWTHLPRALGRRLIEGREERVAARQASASTKEAMAEPLILPKARAQRTAKVAPEMRPAPEPAPAQIAPAVAARPEPTPPPAQAEPAAEEPRPQRPGFLPDVPEPEPAAAGEGGFLSRLFKRKDKAEAVPPPAADDADFDAFLHGAQSPAKVAPSRLPEPAPTPLAPPPAPVPEGLSDFSIDFLRRPPATGSDVSSGAIEPAAGPEPIVEDLTDAVEPRLILRSEPESVEPEPVLDLARLIDREPPEAVESLIEEVEELDFPAPRPPARRSLQLPAAGLLTPGGPAVSAVNMAALEVMAKSLMASLSDFGVRGEVTNIVPGPVVTMFEYKPAPGIKISRITSLCDDLALAMKALAVRIEAIPGKDTVGIEIPNEERQTVFLREVVEADAFQKAKSKLTLALGKDLRGHPFCADLARMPHLLVAGATGAGKSVCLNAIILSLVYKATPEEVKLLLVDPKRIELSVYRELPHLIHPVVAEMSMAKSALEWAVAEMDRRYECMARLGARNVDGYNMKLAAMNFEDHPDLADLEPMPYLVIIIDELADLMITAGKDAEMAIVRLAQLARAAGIHLILATQRPSVDVVTGLIKANFPSRIAFQVTSKHDSRTILDTNGAEYLLGRGDSLYKPSGGKLMRLHGAFVSEDEIARVVDFWRGQCPQRFGVDFAAWQDEAKGEGDSEGRGAEGDELYPQAVEFVVSQGKASISLIQRRFRIGFNRAARFIEQMEMDGLLGPQEGSKPRSVIKGLD